MPYGQVNPSVVRIVWHVPWSHEFSPPLSLQVKLFLPFTCAYPNSSAYCLCSCLVIVSMYDGWSICASVAAIADLPVPVPASSITYFLSDSRALSISVISSSWLCLACLKGKFSIISSSISGCCLWSSSFSSVVGLSMSDGLSSSPFEHTHLFFIIPHFGQNIEFML